MRCGKLCDCILGGRNRLNRAAQAGYLWILGRTAIGERPVCPRISVPDFHSFAQRKSEVNLTRVPDRTADDISILVERRRPHPMHWAVLAKLVSIPLSQVNDLNRQ